MTAPGVVTFSREEFRRERWDYRPGEHCAFIAPQQSGKTTLGFQLLEETATPQMPAVVLVAKPRDTTVTKWRKKLRFRVVRTWPPLVSRWVNKPSGWIVWPRTEFDPAIDRPWKYRVFRTAIHDSYKTRQKRILVADEFFVLCKLLGLQVECEEILASGGSMDCGGWFMTQKPSHVSTWLYGNADHIFLAFDGDERNRKRFGEIGIGIDPKLIAEIVAHLKPYQWLYLRRRGRVMCIIDK